MNECPFTQYQFEIYPEFLSIITPSQWTEGRVDPWHYQLPLHFRFETVTSLVAHSVSEYLHDK